MKKNAKQLKKQQRKKAIHKYNNVRKYSRYNKASHTKQVGLNSETISKDIQKCASSISRAFKPLREAISNILK